MRINNTKKINSNILNLKIQDKDDRCCHPYLLCSEYKKNTINCEQAIKRIIASKGVRRMKKRKLQACATMILLCSLIINSYCTVNRFLFIRKSVTRMKENSYVTTQPVLSYGDFGLDNEKIKQIDYEGTGKVFCFTEEQGFSELKQGENELNGTVKVFTFGLEGKRDVGKMDIKIENGLYRRYLLIWQKNILQIQKVF